MDVASLQQSVTAALETLLDEAGRPRAPAVRQLQAALTDPESPTPRPRPWCAPRYPRTPETEAMWTAVHEGLRPLFTAEAASLRALACGLTLWAPARAAAPTVAALVEDEDTSVALVAPLTLAELEVPETANVLRPWLRAADAIRRRHAAMALTRLGTTEDVAALAGLLADDPDLTTRGWAGWALGSIGTPEAERAMVAALREEHVDAQVWYFLRQGFWELGERVDPLLALATDREQPEPVRRRAVEACVRSPRWGMTADLRAILDAEPDSPVGMTAAWALAERGKATGVADLSRRLRHADEEVSAFAASRLALLGERVGLNYFLARYAAPQHAALVREVVVGLPDALRAQTPQLLDDPDPRVRTAGADLIGVYRIPGQVDALARLRTAAGPESIAAAVALCRLGEQVSQSARQLRERPWTGAELQLLDRLYQPLPLPVLDALFDHEDARLALVAIPLLVLHGPDVAVPRVQAIWEGELARLPEGRGAAEGIADAFAGHQPQTLSAAIIGRCVFAFDALGAEPPQALRQATSTAGDPFLARLAAQFSA